MDLSYVDEMKEIESKISNQFGEFKDFMDNSFKKNQVNVLEAKTNLKNFYENPTNQTINFFDDSYVKIFSHAIIKKRVAEINDNQVSQDLLKWI